MATLFHHCPVKTGWHFSAKAVSPSLKSAVSFRAIRGPRHFSSASPSSKSPGGKEFTLYELKCRGMLVGWTVLRRYAEFADLRDELVDLGVAGVDLDREGLGGGRPEMGLDLLEQLSPDHRT